jgi:hypothetical protein
VVEVPRGQGAPVEQLVRAPFGIGADDYAVKVGEASSDRPGEIPVAPLEREEPNRAAGVLEHGHFDIIADGSDGLRELGAEVGVVKKRIGPLDIGPRGDKVGREPIGGHQSNDGHGGILAGGEKQKSDNEK